MDKVILKIENDLAEKYKYIVWVGGVDDYYSNYKDAKRDADKWKAKGYDDVIIEKIQKGGLKLGESPASFLSCNRTIVRIQRVAGTIPPVEKKNKKS